MEIMSMGFENNEEMPRRYTCDGQDVSPPLIFEEVPEGVESFAIIVDDPDAPGGVFDHWIAWDIPAGTMEISEGSQPGTQGENDFGSRGYRGPCPPPGKPHRYRFKVYALDAKLRLREGSKKGDVEKAMEGHVLDKGELVGVYKR